MKSVEEIKVEIKRNSYPVELSNGQTIYINKLTSKKAYIVYRKDDKSPYGYTKIVSISKEASREEMIERVQNYEDGIKYPSLLKFKRMEDYNKAYFDLIEEVVDAVRDEREQEDFIKRFENGEVFNYYKEEIEGLKQIDADVYYSYLQGSFVRKKVAHYLDLDEFTPEQFPSPFEFGWISMQNKIRALIYFLRKKYQDNPNLDSIVKRLGEKWKVVEI